MAKLFKSAGVESRAELEEVVKGLATPLASPGNELLEFDKFIRNAEPLDVGVDEGEGVLAGCLVSTVLTVTVVPAGIFLVNDSAFLADS